MCSLAFIFLSPHMLARCQSVTEGHREDKNSWGALQLSQFQRKLLIFDNALASYVGGRAATTDVLWCYRLQLGGAMATRLNSADGTSTGQYFPEGRNDQESGSRWRGAPAMPGRQIAGIPLNLKACRGGSRWHLPSRRRSSSPGNSCAGQPGHSLGHSRTSCSLQRAPPEGRRCSC